MATIKAGIYQLDESPVITNYVSAEIKFSCLIGGEFGVVKEYSWFVVREDVGIEYGWSEEDFLDMYNLDDNYWRDVGAQTITIPNDSEVSAEFYEWFTANATEVKSTATIKAGTYRFNDVLTNGTTNDFTIQADVNFTTVFTVEEVGEIICNCTKIRQDSVGYLEYCVASSVPDMSGMGITYPTFFYVWTGDEWGRGMYSTSCQTIVISENTEVSSEFYEWFTANAKPVVASIHYNGSAIASLVGGDTATLKCKGMKMEDDVVVEVAEMPESGGSAECDCFEDVTELPEAVDNSKVYRFQTFTVDTIVMVVDGVPEQLTDYPPVLVDELPEDGNMQQALVIRDSGVGYMYYYGWRSLGAMAQFLVGTALEDKGYVTDEELAAGGLADGVYIHKVFIPNYGIPNIDEKMRKDVYVNEGNGWEKVQIDYIRALVDDDYNNLDMDTVYPLPAGIRHIRPYAFFSSGVFNMRFPDTLIGIGAGAFSQTPISEIDIPESVTEIGTEAFGYCYNLEAVSVPQGKIVIGHRAFYYTPFYENTDNWQNGIFYAGCHLLDTDSKCTGDVVVRDGTRSIQYLAFENATGVTSVTFPDSVVYLNYGALAVPGCYKFTFNSLTPPELHNKAIFTYSNVEFYVPSESVDAYKAADVWKYMADRIFPIEE